MARRVDANQPKIVQALRQYGAKVLCTHDLGKGAPDIICGFRGQNFLFEIKDGDKPPSARKLTEDEDEWHQSWRGQVAVITSVAEAIAFLERVPWPGR
jgi:hypothetical protein